MKSAFLRVTSYVRGDEALERRGVVFPPLRPSRRATDSLSRYDRLDPAAPPRPAQEAPQVEPGSPMDAVAGMERLRAALDALAVKVAAAKQPHIDEFGRAMARGASGADGRCRHGQRCPCPPPPPCPAPGRR